MTIEQEIRFYFPSKELAFWQKKLRQLKYRGQYYELTVMYDNPNPAYTFYASSIDGRLWLRVATPLENKNDFGLAEGYGLISWKQRIPEFQNEKIEDAKEQLTRILIRFGLNLQQASTYSCDDMYRALCLKKKKQPKPDILFNDPDMPCL